MRCCRGFPRRHIWSRRYAKDADHHHNGGRAGQLRRRVRLYMVFETAISRSGGSGNTCRAVARGPDGHIRIGQSRRFVQAGRRRGPENDDSRGGTEGFDLRDTREDEGVQKERFLAEEEQRILSARKTLEEDITRLSELHDALNVVVGRLKQQEENLKNRILEISAVEKGNLQRIAATYDKMDVTQSSKIIINMASTKQLEDAVKIIHLMSERTAAKLLGEISTTKPDLASLLSTELKRVKEGE